MTRLDESWASRRAVAATGLLADFNTAGILDAPDIHVASTLGWLTGRSEPAVLLAAALVVRARRAGSTCLPWRQAAEFAARLDRGTDAADPVSLPWPDEAAWEAALAESPLLGHDAGPDRGQPLRLHAGRLYLARDWDDQEAVAQTLDKRWRATPPRVDEAALYAALDRVLGPSGDAATRAAVTTAARSWTTVVAGGPGTGKTTLVAALVDVLSTAGLAAPYRVAVAAPTGKAAARAAQAWSAAGRRQPDGSSAIEVATATVHRLLGSRGPGAGFRHGPDNPLPYDLVVVDEMSMVSLSLMARLVTSIAPGSRLVLLGDPAQLSSVEAGTVLADLVDAGLTRTAGSTDPGTVTLDRSWRFQGGIADLAAAVRSGDADAAIDVLTSGDDTTRLLETDAGPSGLNAMGDLGAHLGAQARSLRDAVARDDDAAALRALDAHRLMCAHREGPYGASRWGRAAEAWANEGAYHAGLWYPGRAVLLTANQSDWGVSNGDQGVVVAGPRGLEVVFGDPTSPRRAPLGVLEGLQPLYAITVHKAQGSQYDQVSLILPPPGSPLLTRELFYTAITRARHGVQVMGSREAVRLAIGTRAWRASGLAERIAEIGRQS